MPATSFPEYAQTIQQIMEVAANSGEAPLTNIQIDQRSALRGFITGLLQFNDASELHFREFVDTSQVEPRLMYAYHYQDSYKLLIFRYDNAAHRPALPQADHKHTPAGIELCPPPTLTQILDEILKSR